ncbi:hypothetical protein ACU4GR_19905 [Methylobacterium oryzae CBMB20]
MVVAALLFLVGWLIGRSYSVIIVGMTSSVILLAAMTMFMAVYGLDLVRVLIVGISDRASGGLSPRRLPQRPPRGQPEQLNRITTTRPAGRRDC